MPRLSLGLVFASLVLTGCTASGPAYVSGPWGQSRPLDPTLSLYSSPWNAPIPEPVVPPAFPETAYPEAVAPQPAGPVPLEPMGPWASRPIGPSEESLGTSPDANLPLTEKPAPTPPGPEAGAVVSAEPEHSSIPQPEPRARGISSLVGKWTMKEGGGSCQLQLSSASTLDLYKASTSSCRNQALQEVNTWNLRNSAIELYARGRTVMRLQQNGSDYIGRLGNQGPTIVMSR
jgi:hypothetical protein